jgi:hypothetical protein
MRNDMRETFVNQTEEYKELIKKRGRKLINQYETPKLVNFKPEDYVDLEVVRKVWKTGDRLYKLADLYYNDATMWWVIALFNNKPTESHFKVGDIVYIPTSIEEVTNIIGYK